MLPKSNKINQLKSWLRARILSYRPLQVNKETWDTQFSSGHWDYLHQLGQLARYSVIAGYYNYYFCQGGSVLDLGCGDGILQERLVPYSYLQYTGVDISSEAIAKASLKNDEKTVFITANIENYNPGRSFDFIVFNELLYYFEDPLNIMRKFEPFLNEQGIFLVSMWFFKERNNKIWKMIESFYTPEDEIKVSHQSGKTWIIKVFKPQKTRTDSVID